MGIKMKKLFLLLFSIVALSFFTACASYPPGASKADIWKIRYDNVYLTDDDSFGLATWKVSKHVFWDVFTLCFAEIEYARIRRNHYYWLGVAIREKKQKDADEQLRQFCKTLWGKKRTAAIAAFGPNDEEKTDGEGGKILTWEQNVETLNARGFINLWTPSVTMSTRRTIKTERYIIWFSVDKNGIIYGSGITRR